MEQKGKLVPIALLLGFFVLLSLLVSWITFGLLDSSATAEIRGYKLGGAIAAFAFTAALLFTAFHNVYRLITADQEYVKKIAELEAKLIKGAPCPPGYSIEIDERHKLVFARPTNWKPWEGYLYKYVEPPRSPGRFVANCDVRYRPLSELLHTDEDLDPSKPHMLVPFYEQIAQKTTSKFPGSTTQEYIEVDGLKSLKYTNTRPVQGDKPYSVCISGVVVYVPKQAAVYFFTFGDDSSGYLTSSEVFNSVIGSVRFL